MTRSPQPRFEPAVGRYLRVEIGGKPHRVYVEQAGEASPSSACIPLERTAASIAGS